MRHWTQQAPLETCPATYHRTRCERVPGHTGDHRGRTDIGGRLLIWAQGHLDPVAQAKADLEAALARRAHKQGASA